MNSRPARPQLQALGRLTLPLVLAASLTLSGCGYNDFQRLDEQTRAAWSEVLNQFQRRADLIPNLVETVKGFAGQEEKVFTQVTEMRTRAMGATGVADKAAAENQLNQTLKSLFAVAEAYPELKSNTNFLDLQSKLADLEDQIQMARRYYNGTVRENNVLVESFPSNFVARLGGFGKGDFFELEDEGERKTPQVKFN